MSWTAADHRAHRERRAAAGKCQQCGGPLDPESDSGYRLCIACRLDHGERNRAWYARHHGVARRIDVREQLRAERRHAEACALRAFAVATGRVPTLTEAARIIGHAHPTCNTVQHAVRDTFNVRKRTKREVRVVIPYPVPDEWKATP